MTTNPTTTTLRKLAFPVLSGLMLVLAAVGLLQQKSDASQALAVQAAEIAQFEQALASQTDQAAVSEETAVALGAGAPSGEVDAALARIDSDADVIGDVLEMMFTWDSHATYEGAREALRGTYGLAADSDVLSKLMPESPVQTDADGKEYPYIDAAGLNSSLGTYDITPTMVRSDQYSYLVMASVQASSSDGSASASRTNVVEITTDGAGQIVSLSSSAAPTAARESAGTHS